MRKEYKAISANEINKFMYCPYQWYYEKCYGTAQLRKMRAELLSELGYEDKTKANFIKGLEAHENFGLKQGGKLRKLLYITAFMAGTAFALYYIFMYYIA